MTDRMVCHEAVGPSSSCWLGRPVLAASLPDTRNPSRPGCLADSCADDAGQPLASAVRASQPLASAVRAAARPLRAHAETGLLSLPGALCITTVTTGSQPESSVLVVHSSPDLVVAAAAKAVLERQ